MSGVTTSNISTYDLIHRALLIFNRGFIPWVSSKMRELYGSNWIIEVSNDDSDQ
jgi:hypothetical protein